ncbi:MAG: PH domain-containing protein [Lapillicoccus sp.]
MPRRLDPKLDRFLLPGERVVVDVRQHWGVIAWPVTAVLAGLVVVLWVDAHVRLDGGPIARALWLVWFGAVGWMLFQVVQWRHDRFIATDKRLLLDYGIFTTKVAMMPLAKVTDMSFQRSVPGRVFGWGRFILESAGQDQALRQIDWVPDPDHTYRLICAEIFGVLDDGLGEEDDNRPQGHGGRDDPDGPDGPDGPGGRDGPVAHGPVPSPLGGFGPITTGRRGGPDEPRWWSAVEAPSGHSRAIPIHRRRDAGDASGEVLYSSDADRRRRRAADTGPIPVPPQQGD